MNRLHFIRYLILALSWSSSALPVQAEPTGAVLPLAPGNVYTNETQPLFTWQSRDQTYSDEGPVTPSTYELIIDGKKVAAGIKGTSLVSPVALSPGPHTWSVGSSPGTMSFTIGTPPKSLWENTDHFDSGNLYPYLSEGIVVTKGDMGKYVLSFTPGNGKHFAYDPNFSNFKEAESSILFSLMGSNAIVGVGFSSGDYERHGFRVGISPRDSARCYAFVDPAAGKWGIERQARYSIFDHTESGHTKTEWKERQIPPVNGDSKASPAPPLAYIWTAIEGDLPKLPRGQSFRLRFQLSNRLPSMGKAAQAILEDQDGNVISSLRTFLDDVNTPHPLLIGSGPDVRIEEFSHRALDRWAYNWTVYPRPLNLDFPGYNPVVWRDKQTKKWFLWPAYHNCKIHWSDDGIHWSLTGVPGPPVYPWDPSIVGMYGDPWNEGRTYLCSPGGNYGQVQIYSTSDVLNGEWTKYSDHPGLKGRPRTTHGSGREHVILDSKDWPKLAPFVYQGQPYRFLHINEGDDGQGGSTMIRLSNDLKNFVVVDHHNLFGSPDNFALEKKNLWTCECLNTCASCAAAIDGDIRVMTFKDGRRYLNALPLEAILDGKEPWKVKAIQTIPAFPYYWGAQFHGKQRVIRDKFGAAWYAGGTGEWPACYVWVEETRTLYCYWGEEDTICLSTARIVPEISCTQLSVPKGSFRVGEEIPVRATISNTGSAEGEEEIAFFLDGEKVHTEKVHLAANADTEVSFALPSPKQGQHLLRIRDHSFAFQVGSLPLTESSTNLGSGGRRGQFLAFTSNDHVSKNGY